MSKHEEMRTRLGWTISYKSLYFVHPSLEWVPLFTGMRERSIRSTLTIIIMMPDSPTVLGRKGELLVPKTFLAHGKQRIIEAIFKSIQAELYHKYI